METSVGVGEKRAGGRMEGDGLGLGFGSSSAFSVHLPPQKLVRTQEFPFRMVATAPRPSGPTLFYGGSCDAYEATSAPQPLPSPSRPPGLAMGEGGATAAGLRSFHFTQAQWQELQRQAMIYKHFVASVPVPTELLFPMSPSSFPDAPTHLLPSTLLCQGGGASFNVRSKNSGDLEPGRCRRTDGKKWRCARDVAPGQKYCERHVHRGRPRSRKHVELCKPKPTTPTATAASSSTHGATTTATGDNVSARTTATTVSQAFPVHSCGFLPKPELKLPFMSMEPTKDPRYLDWTKGNGEMASSHQWELMQSKIGLRSTDTPVVQHDEFNLNYTDLNDQYCGLLNPNLSLEDDTVVDHREPPRSFIDAWSTETLTAATNCDKSSTTYSGKLPLSTLSLSVCGGVEEDADRVQMGLGLGDSVAQSQPSSWMAPGPLGEMLQSSNVTSPQHGSNNSKRSCGAGLSNIMSRGCCGSQDASPQESPTRLASSPSGVLQKGLVSLSDSSCSSSPTFAAAACRPEFTLEWVDQSK